MAAVNSCRFAQTVAGSFSVWTVLLAAGGLWAIPCSALVRIGFETWLVERKFRPFFQDLKSQASGSTLSGTDLSEISETAASAFSWKTEVLPLQWRIALQSMAGYFAMGLYTPIIFKYHGVVVGGQMGMTWNAISTIQIAAFAWIQTRIPEIGRLIADRKVDDSRKLFRRVAALSAGIYLLGCTSFLTLLWLLTIWIPDVADRLLAIDQASLLCVAMGLSHLKASFEAYVRTLKIDPFLWIGVISAALMGILVWFLGKQYGTPGIAFAHIGVVGLLSLPVHYLIYRRTRTTA